MNPAGKSKETPSGICPFWFVVQIEVDNYGIRICFKTFSSSVEKLLRDLSSYMIFLSTHIFMNESQFQKNLNNFWHSKMALKSKCSPFCLFSKFFKNLIIFWQKSCIQNWYSRAEVRLHRYLKRKLSNWLRALLTQS